MRWLQLGKRIGASFMSGIYREWLGQRQVSHLGSNHGAAPVAFSDWYHFKEAFSPELVARALASTARPTICIDPFAGSGTTAVTCQMLGCASHSIEVNPFLCDLAASKVASYDIEKLTKAAAQLLDKAAAFKGVAPDELFSTLPKTFIEPGKKEHWVFNRDVASAVAAFVLALEHEADPVNKRLIKTAIGACLIPASNVLVNGKGRRYRRSWQTRRVSGDEFYDRVRMKLTKIINDVSRYSRYFKSEASILHADARHAGHYVPEFDVAVFSPPYPNSFDYTDVYNVELWVLGYLRGRRDDRFLRARTLSSHVQISRAFAPPPAGSPILDETIEALELLRAKLWHKNIPAMIGSYFNELFTLVTQLMHKRRAGGSMWIVIGNSQYAGQEIRSAEIIAQLCSHYGISSCTLEETRSMRNSPQQGGQSRLSEYIMVLR